MTPAGFRAGRVRRRGALSGSPLAMDVEGEVRRRLTVLCHVWPGLTPWNVWGLAWCDWLIFAATADEWVKQRNDKGGSRG